MNMMKIAAAAGTPTDQANSIDDDEVIVVFKLTKDLILEILSHLPPINLLRFKSVSKTWYSLISNNPVFLRRNTANQFDKQRITTTTTTSSDLLSKHLYFYNAIAGHSRILTLLPPSDDNDDDQQAYYYYFHQKLLIKKLCSEHGSKLPLLLARVIDSCNALLLFSHGLKQYDIASMWKYTLYVCNPITHDYIKLPTFCEQEEREQGFRIINNSSPNIVFDPSVSLTYKVVTWLKCTIKEEQEWHYRLYVYSSETRSWKLSISTNQFPVDPNQFEFILRGVLCNGVLYWTPRCPSFDTDVSLCYDVEYDVLDTLKFPKMPPEYRYRVLLYFGECGGRLRLIETYSKGQRDLNFFPSIFDVMELVDNNDDLWIVKYRVNVVDDQEGYFANRIGNTRPTVNDVHIWDLYKKKTQKASGEHQGEEEEEEELLLKICEVCIITFNLSSNKFGKELRDGEKKSAEERFVGFPFTDILRYNTITLFPPSFSS